MCTFVGVYYGRPCIFRCWFYIEICCDNSFVISDSMDGCRLIYRAKWLSHTNGCRQHVPSIRLTREMEWWDGGGCFMCVLSNMLYGNDAKNEQQVTSHNAATYTVWTKIQYRLTSHMIINRCTKDLLMVCKTKARRGIPCYYLLDDSHVGLKICIWVHVPFICS